MPKKGALVKFKIFERKIKLLFIIYAAFESKIQKSLIQTSTKNILLAAMDMN